MTQVLASVIGESNKRSFRPSASKHELVSSIWILSVLIWEGDHCTLSACHSPAASNSDPSEFRGKLANMHVRHTRISKNYFKCNENLIELSIYNKGRQSKCLIDLIGSFRTRFKSFFFVSMPQPYISLHYTFLNGSCYPYLIIFP
jgi:hypothetical protein